MVVGFGVFVVGCWGDWFLFVCVIVELCLCCFVDWWVGVGCRCCVGVCVWVRFY